MARSVGVGPFSPKTPDAPYFSIKIQDTIYDIDINFLTNFELNRVWDDIGKFSFTMIDYADLNLERKFMALFATATDMQPQISLQYGWHMSEKSPWYRGFLTNYDPQFISGGLTRITVKGQIMEMNASVESVKAYKGKSISDIITEIAEDQGWIIEELDQTIPLDEKRTFQVPNIGIVDYIRKYLEPIAINTKNEPMRFYAETLDGGATHIWFISVNKATGAVRNYNFFINMGNYGSVLEFSPSYSGITAASCLDLATFDLDTNDVCVYGNASKDAAAKDGATLTIYGSTTPDQMAPMLANKWYQMNIGAVTATLTIVGDPLLRPHETIRIVPMMADGKPHVMTSGTYLIKQVTDTVDTNFKTTLELVKQIDKNTAEKPLVEAVQFRGQE